MPKICAEAAATEAATAADPNELAIQPDREWNELI